VIRGLLTQYARSGAQRIAQRLGLGPGYATRGIDLASPWDDSRAPRLLAQCHNVASSNYCLEWDVMVTAEYSMDIYCRPVDGLDDTVHDQVGGLPCPSPRNFVDARAQG